MDNLNQGKQTTLLDLNIDVLDKIFRALEHVSDKVNLAKVHPRLTNAFDYHGRLRFKRMKLIQHFGDLHDKENILLILKHCGEHVQYLEIIISIEADILQIIVDSCPNLSTVRFYYFLGGSVRLPDLARLPLRTIEMGPFCFGQEHFIELLRNCKTLRKVEYFNGQYIDIDFIRNVINVLVENGVTPEDPFEIVVNKKLTILDDDLLAETSLYDKQNLLKVRRIDYDVS